MAAVLTTTVGDGTKQQGQTSVSGIWLLVGAVLGALLKFGQVCLKIFESRLQGIINMGRSNIGGGENEPVFYGGVATSPALLGVGWIIGPRIASFVFVGGLLGWVIITPLIALAAGIPAGLEPIDGFFYMWEHYIRYIGVGAMFVGGLYTIFKLRANLADGLREAVIGLKGGQTPRLRRAAEETSRKIGD